MNPSSTLLHVQSFLSTGLYNFDSSRFQKPSLEERVEGWTETWGAKASDDGDHNDNDEDDDRTAKRRRSCWEQENDDVELLLATSHPQYPIILTQFRVAWLEQVVLRIAKIPHIVLNSTYLCSEATGELPYLQDLDSPLIRSQEQTENFKSVKQTALRGQSSLSSTPPVLVGRRHPSILIDHYSTDNHILKYLKDERGIDFDTCLTSDHQRGLARCFLRMIQSDLNASLTYLRYEDRNCWEQVYLQQYLHAGHPVDRNERPGWFQILQGRLQASMHRSVWRRRLIEYSSQVQSVEQVVERVKECYQSLDAQLSSHSKPYLLGTDKPALVDAYLFGHLADAIGDVNLVVILASFPRLVQFLQMMVQTNFLDGCVEKSDWAKWNRGQNESNAFQQIPIMKSAWSSSKSTKGKPKFQDAVELMESLSLQKSDLNVILTTAKAKRDREPWPEASRPIDSMLYRWCMGEDIEMKRPTKKASDDDDPGKALRKKVLREQTRHDQTWISGVLAASVIAILLMQAGNTSTA